MQWNSIWLVLVLSGAILGGRSSFAEQITIIHTNDIHAAADVQKMKLGARDEGKGGGFATFSSFLKKVRTESSNVLLLDAGDVLTGGFISRLEAGGAKGGVLIHLMNLVRYDAWVPGNHDFDEGQENIRALAKIAKFPTLNANIVLAENGARFFPDAYRIFSFGNVKVAVVGVAEENFLKEVLNERIEGLDVMPVAPTVQAYVEMLRPKVNLMVVVASQSFDDCLDLADVVPGIDVILAASEDGKFEVRNGVLVKSTIGHLKTAGYLSLNVAEGGLSSFKEGLIVLDPEQFKPDPEVDATLGKYSAEIEKVAGRIVGMAKVDLVRTEGESNIGNWITDVMRWRVSADVAFHNEGGIRKDIKAGPITLRDIKEVSPFGDTLVTFRMTGQQLKDALEYDIKRGFDRMQVSGVRYTYAMKRPFRHRILSLEIKGKPFDKNKLYNVVSNNYVMGHAKDKYFGFALDKASNVYNMDILLEDAQVEWLEKFKEVNVTLEARIVELAEGQVPFPALEPLVPGMPPGAPPLAPGR